MSLKAAMPLEKGSFLFIFRHAKRSTVQSDDVKLLARKNPSLAEHLKVVQDSKK